MGALTLVRSWLRPYHTLCMVPVSISLYILSVILCDVKVKTYMRTRASSLRTRRTNARVLPSLESSGRLAPPGDEDTRVSVAPLVRFLEKIAYIPEWTSEGILASWEYSSFTERRAFAVLESALINDVLGIDEGIISPPYELFWSNLLFAIIFDS